MWRWWTQTTPVSTEAAASSLHPRGKTRCTGDCGKMTPSPSRPCRLAKLALPAAYSGVGLLIPAALLFVLVEFVPTLETDEQAPPAAVVCVGENASMASARGNLMVPSTY